MRATPSLPSSPASSPCPLYRSSTAAPQSATGAVRLRASAAWGASGGKNTRSKLTLAGLVAGDSDSSALTQESGDEGAVAETPRESVVTGTDGGTEYAEDEDTEMREPSTRWLSFFVTKRIHHP